MSHQGYEIGEGTPAGRKEVATANNLCQAISRKVCIFESMFHFITFQKNKEETPRGRRAGSQATLLAAAGETVAHG